MCSHQAVACVNRRIQRACAASSVAGPSEGVEIFPTPEKGGWGLRATRSFGKGDVVAEYLGEEVAYEAVHQRRVRQLREGRQNYLIVLCENISTKENGEKRLHTCVDASWRGNVARFANHSCDPNMLPLPVRTGRCSPRIVFFAARSIAVGEELTISYGSARVGAEGDPRKICLCGANTCGGFLPFDLD